MHPSKAAMEGTTQFSGRKFSRDREIGRVDRPQAHAEAGQISICNKTYNPMNASDAELKLFRFRAKPTLRPSLHHVEFFCKAPNASRVCVAGDFNGWSDVANPMQKAADGCWTAALELRVGYHEYYFLVDGIPMLDPRSAGTSTNEQCEPVSLLAVS